MTSMIQGRDIRFSYEYEDSETLALKNVSIEIKAGELVAILGHNGCGKSTLVKHFNALLPLQRGELSVAGMDVRDGDMLYELRRTCGMLFQNPDNQFVSSLVEEDVAFGLENYEVPAEEIPARVRRALSAVGMDGYEKRAPHMLSGGQKQRVALAGVLAMEPDILVFDEATAMLDPEGRREVLDMIQKLHREGRTIVMISHYVEEAVFADRVYLIHDGEVLSSGTPREMLTDPELMARTGLIPPMPVRLYCDLQEAGVRLARCPLTDCELVEALTCP